MIWFLSMRSLPQMRKYDFEYTKWQSATLCRCACRCDGLFCQILYWPLCTHCLRVSPLEWEKEGIYLDCNHRQAGTPPTSISGARRIHKGRWCKQNLASPRVARHSRHKVFKIVKDWVSNSLELRFPRTDTRLDEQRTFPWTDVPVQFPVAYACSHPNGSDYYESNIISIFSTD